MNVDMRAAFPSVRRARHAAALEAAKSDEINALRAEIAEAHAAYAVLRLQVAAALAETTGASTNGELQGAIETLRRGR